MKSAAYPAIGDRFGCWVVVDPDAGKNKSHQRMAVCQCDCGKEGRVAAYALVAGRSAKCMSCRVRLRRPKHGMYGTPTYITWCSVIQRTTNPSDNGWRLYGGKGVTICDRWRYSFESFLVDMGPRPPGTTLDRWPNKTGNYEPGNCRWATWKQQGRNRINNRNIDFQGVTCTLAEWAERTGISDGAIRYRLRKGWPIGDALTIPVGGARSGQGTRTAEHDE